LNDFNFEGWTSHWKYFNRKKDTFQKSLRFQRARHRDVWLDRNSCTWVCTYIHTWEAMDDVETCCLSNRRHSSTSIFSLGR
jgi:hypothetical protein